MSAALAVGGGAAAAVALSTSNGALRATPPASAPQPPTGRQLAEFVPASYVVTKESVVRLDAPGPPLVVVTDSQGQPGSSGLASSDLLLLAWDGYVHRWVVAFDGARTPGPNAGVGGANLSQDAILPSSGAAHDLTFQTISPTPGRTDLVFWADETLGADGWTAVGIVHYDGSNASLAYDADVNASAPPTVVGPAGHQTLRLGAEWVTSADAQVSPLRDYTQVVSLVAGPGGYPTYAVTADSRSWLGVYAIETPNAQPGPTAPLVVIAVAPGSPASGVLQPGDEILSVNGVAPHNGGFSTAPAAIDEVASQQPGTPIALSIMRGGQQTVVNATLSSYGSQAFAAASPPQPGYMGITSSADSPAVAYEYGLSVTSGAVITQVVPGSPADTAGLVPYDTITAVDSRPVASAGDTVTIDAEAGAGTTVPVTYVAANGETANTSVTLGSFPNQTPGPFVYGM